MAESRQVMGTASGELLSARKTRPLHLQYAGQYAAVFSALKGVFYDGLQSVLDFVTGRLQAGSAMHYVIYDSD